MAFRDFHGGDDGASYTLADAKNLDVGEAVLEAPGRFSADVKGAVVPEFREGSPDPSPLR